MTNMMKVLSYLRSLLLIPIMVLHTLFCSFLVIFSLVLRMPRAVADFLIGTLWCGLIVRFSGIDVIVEGEENVPKDKGFLYLFTHSSHLDIPVMFYKSPKSFRFGAKSSLFKIPVFGYAVKLSGTLPITRENRSKVIEVYKQAEKRVAAGEAFALSPEGGRRRTDDLLDFKSGPFIFAINAKMPIVPVVLCGVDRCLKKGSILINSDQWTRKVGMRILPAIDVSQIPVEDVKAFKNKVRDQFLQEFEDMKKTYL